MADSADGIQALLVAEQEAQAIVTKARAGEFVFFNIIDCPMTSISLSYEPSRSLISSFSLERMSLLQTL
jgi:hypothetical protein